MNKDRRRRISEIIDELNGLQEKIYSIKDEEDEQRDNMPENLQASQRYEDSQGYSDIMDLACESIGEAINYLDEIINN